MGEQRGATDKLKGKTKETVGKITGDDRKKSKGRTDQTKGKAKGTMATAKEKAAGMKESLKDTDRSGGRRRSRGQDQGKGMGKVRGRGKDKG
jgi:uncharacterized protein YjbJ (UPF0337 family)